MISTKKPGIMSRLDKRLNEISKLKDKLHMKIVGKSPREEIQIPK